MVSEALLANGVWRCLKLYKLMVSEAVLANGVWSFIKLMVSEALLS